MREKKNFLESSILPRVYQPCGIKMDPSKCYTPEKYNLLDSNPLAPKFPNPIKVVAFFFFCTWRYCP